MGEGIVNLLVSLTRKIVNYTTNNKLERILRLDMYLCNKLADYDFKGWRGYLQTFGTILDRIKIWNCFFSKNNMGGKGRIVSNR